MASREFVGEGIELTDGGNGVNRIVG
jgi:hypothetical protein